MGAPTFGQDRKSFIWLLGYDGAKYRLFKSTWELKILHDERAHLGQNFDLIVDTLKIRSLFKLAKRMKIAFLPTRNLTTSAYLRRLTIVLRS
jgi:hypothetical protein